ncbi:MAG: YraN family protein [Candidatus Brocadiaceae bacterium]|nr:YraN family protein [Candidatus Brocadiaceae bacterium]
MKAVNQINYREKCMLEAIKNLLFKQKKEVRGNNNSLATKGESLAAKFLKRKGYIIVQRNYRRKTGEIDIVCYDHGTMVFVEVKTRCSDAFGPPELAITNAKKKQLVKVASCYIAEKKIEDMPLRFDVVSIFYSPSRKQPTVKIFKSAFTRNDLVVSRR